ncbi:lipid-transfer protein [Mycolicibacterium thermoresistibile]|nr:lipid-transfer protein [Mycolicibacterium thermoresistibile]
MPVAIVGVGESDHVHKSGHSAAALARTAVDRALADAGLSPGDVDGFVIEGMSTAHTVPVDAMAQSLGLRHRPFSCQSSIAGAGLVGAPLIAQLAIESGLAEVVVTYFGLTLDPARGGAYAVHAEDPWKAAVEMPAGWFGQPVYFAAMAQRYAHEYGLPPEALAEVAGAARSHAARTPGALLPEPLDVTGYLASPMIATPLRKADCCLTNDGAIAFVMTTPERARDLTEKPVLVAGVGIAGAATTQTEYFTQRHDFLSLSTDSAARQALGMAGLSMHDVDIAELYDCFTITTIIQLEDLGVAPRGEGAAYVLDVGIGPRAPLPVNTHGGLLAHSYLLAGNHLIEAVRQLRGERGEGQVPDAEVALVTGLGIPDMACAVLTSDR